jgi:hypothetical protein
MAIWNLKSSIRLQVFCSNPVKGKVFLDELSTSGILFSIISHEKGLRQVLEKERILLLIEPVYDPAFSNEWSKILSDKDEPVFILSSDLRWKELAPKNICFYLPADTHPMELARLLVEKLNLPTVSNKTSYAFSFFQF